MDLIEAAAAEFERAVRAIPAHAWDAATPSDMPVRDLVQHVVVGNRFTALLLSGVDRDEARAALAGDQLGDDPLAAVIDSSRRQSAAFAAAPADRVVAGPRGPVTATAFARFRVIDLVVHAWDLRRGAGLDEALDERTVLDLLAAVEPHLDELISYGAYGEGPSGALPDDASPQQRLLDAFGRRS